jgi:propanol-preferring alcohol dehydrogenase
VLDAVGTDQTLAHAAAVIRPAGEISVIGLAGGTLPFRFGALPFDCTIIVPCWDSAVELMEVVELAHQGKIRAHVQRFPLNQVTDAYQRLPQGGIDGRAVITPQES